MFNEVCQFNSFKNYILFKNTILIPLNRIIYCINILLVVISFNSSCTWSKLGIFYDD